jgi:hypothetical protein
MRKQLLQSPKAPGGPTDGATSPLREARAQAMLTYLKTCCEFRTDRHLYPFTFQGWSRAQIEAALDQLVNTGLVELSVGLGEVPFVAARLKHPEGPDER